MAALPKTVGTCADKLYQLEREIAALRKKQEAELKKLTGRRDELAEHALGLLNKQKTTSARGHLGQITKSTTVSPQLKDFDALWAHMRSSNAHDLLQHRLRSSAVRARWDAGETVPGVGKHMQMRLSITKVGGRSR